MTMISSLHNLSRSVGVALLAATGSDKMYVVYFVGSEVLLYLVYKIVRNDVWYWPRLDGCVTIVVSIIERIFVKIIVDFSGCVHLRHSYELGGLAYSVSVVWAQIFPFVVLQLYEDDGGDLKDSMALFLVCSLVVWILLNAAFFMTINLEYVDTFFGIKTAPQYTCDLFNSESEAAKFSCVFENRIQYTTTIHAEVKEWVAENIDRWVEEKPTWFKIAKLPKEFLPAATLQSEGGGARRRSNVSLRESFVFDSKRASYRVHPQESLLSN